MGGTTSKQDTQQQSIQQIPQWIQQAGQQNYAYAQDVANQPLQQYQGQMVPDVAPQTQQFWNVAAQAPSVGQDQFQGATAGLLGSLGQTPSRVTPQTLAGTDLAPYMNPYTQDVINKTIPIMQQQLGVNQVGNQNQANAANAFGGSRMGVQQGVTQAQGAMDIGQMVAQLNQANFNQAQQGATGDISRNMTAQQANQAAQQAKINSDIAASQGLGGLGETMNRTNASNAGLLSAAGASQSLQAQNQINAQIAKFAQAFGYPQQQLATLLSALGMTPHDTATQGSSQTQTTTPTDWTNLITGGLGVVGNLIPKPIPAAKGLARVPGPLSAGDTVPAMLTPGEAVLNKGAAAKLGRDKISKLNQDGVRRYARGTSFVSPPLTAFTPPSSPGVAKGISAMTAFTPPARSMRYAALGGPPAAAAKGALSNPRAGARAGGGLANTKRRPSIIGALG